MICRIQCENLRGVGRPARIAIRTLDLTPGEGRYGARVHTSSYTMTFLGNSEDNTEPAFASVLSDHGARGPDEAPMSRSDCPSQDTLADFVLGKLPLAELGTVAEHLDVCTECEEKTAQLDGMTDAVVSKLRRIPAPVPDIGGERTEADSPPGAAGMPRATEPWGEFRIVREIGRGGMGVVWEAYQGSLNRHVALKLLPEHGNLSRFRREAQAAGRLHHTHIVPVFGVGEHQGRHFYVMQYIVGRGLDAAFKERTVAAADTGRSSGRAGAREAARIGAQVAEALAYAHGHGVIHRDIKPSNLLLDDQGTVWVTDFGVAKVVDEHDLTGTGDFLGTLRYMPPEAFEGKHDARGDIYSLGLTLYELIAGRPAYHETERARLIRLITTVDPPRLREFDREVPRDLETVIHQAIERDPGHRYQTAALLAEDLKRFIEDRPIQARQANAVERYWRWAKRNPAIAGLGGVLTGVLVLATVCSLLVMDRFRTQAAAQARLPARVKTHGRGRIAPGERRPWPAKRPTRSTSVSLPARRSCAGPCTPLVQTSPSPAGKPTTSAACAVSSTSCGPAQTSPTSAAGSGATSGSLVTRTG